jgi:hypothetical protein
MVLNIQTVHHILKNTAVQNVNKPFVYITDLTSPLSKGHYFLKFYQKNTKLLDFFEILPKLLPKFYFTKTFPRMTKFYQK